MKTIVGIKSLKEAGYFFAQGADEVYCGLTGLPNNRLPMENFSEIRDIEALLELAGRKHKVFLAANVVINGRDFPKTLGLLRRLTEKGLSGVILRDPALLAYFKREKFKSYFILSTLANCFNVQSLGFFADLGISRIVLPMQMMPENAAGLISNPYGIETEIFCQALYYGINVDSRCELPCPQDGRRQACGFPDYTCLLPFKSPSGTFHMPLPDQRYMLGAFYDYYQAGVRRVKIARWPNARREADVFSKVQHLTGLLAKGISRQAFISKGLTVDSKPMEYGQSFTLNPL